VSDDDPYARLILETLDIEYRQDLGDFSPTALPLLTCKAAGGAVLDAVSVAAGWRALYIAAKLLDDVEDRDAIKINSHVLSPEVAINLATGFITLSNLALLENDPDSATLSYIEKKDILTEFNRTTLYMASGQHRDITPDKRVDMEAYREIMSAKSGSFFQLASWAGAKCATQNQDMLSLFEALGYNLGMMLQINDDLKDFRETTAGNDLTTGHLTFPVIYALSVASPSEKERLEKWLSEAANNPRAEENARDLVRTLGGEVYVLAEIMRYRRRTTTVLKQMDLPTEIHSELEKWLSRLSMQSKRSGRTNL